jgi:serine phosphatase RsbU (regulator of sigma subunit)
MEIIKDNASSPARELEDTVFKAVMEFSRGAEQADDIAVLVVEFH